MVTLTGFADEISQNLDEQVATLQELGIRYLELRGVNGKNVLNLTDEEVESVKKTLQEAGIGVSAIGSPIGKYGIADDFDTQMEQLKRIITIAKALDTKYIRGFSFWMPKDEDPATYRDEVMRRMKAMVELTTENGLRYLHENEKGIYGDTAARCVDLLDTVGPQLGCIFDPANFVQVGEDVPGECFPALRDRIEYVHVKDARASDGVNVPAGEGDGGLPEVLKGLIVEDGFDGFLSLEPHLQIAGASSGFSGPQLFKQATDALKKILDELGVEYQ
ncbi:MAG: sugar phosphate isomerase/epimerase [Firmicutes bacterium]|nr:sugar phosphate isomerase/epimerase [Bacillota bacterium]